CFVHESESSHARDLSRSPTLLSTTGSSDRPDTAIALTDLPTSLSKPFSDILVSIPDGIGVGVLYENPSSISAPTNYAKYASAETAKAISAPGGHSSPGLKARGFLAGFINQSHPSLPRRCR